MAAEGEPSDRDREWVAAVAEKEARKCADESAARVASRWFKIIMAGAAGFTLCAVLVGYHSAEGFLRTVAVRQVDAYFAEKGGERLTAAMGSAEKQLGEAQGLLKRLQQQEDALQGLAALERLERIEKQITDLKLNDMLPGPFGATIIAYEGMECDIVLGSTVHRVKVEKIKIEEALVAVTLKVTRGTVPIRGGDKVLLRSVVVSKDDKRLILEPKMSLPIMTSQGTITFSVVKVWKEGFQTWAVIKYLIHPHNRRRSHEWLLWDLESDTDKAKKAVQEMMRRARGLAQPKTESDKP